MIIAGALPNVALSRPPTASPVRVESCSVACTINAAIGTIASAAEKKITGGGRWPTCSRATVTGMKTNSQWMDGFIDISQVCVGLDRVSFIRVTTVKEKAAD